MILEYINNLNTLFKTGNAREHSYRGDFQNLLNKIINDKSIIVTNEPARIVNVGAPDFSITKDNIPIGYIEAKDIDKNINDKKYNEQFNRYKNALDNLIITNYIDFNFYKQAKLVKSISIGKLENNKIIPLKENFDEFIDLIKDFTSYISQTIKSPLKLAELMANKARLLKDVIDKVLEDEESTLQNEYKVFQKSLIHDIKKDEFADIYAQTIAFGMFIARYHDYTLEDFSREEAQKLIPKFHPFLRGLFKYISDDDVVDERIIWIIDSLANVFLTTNIREIFEKKQDPVIHFYETFLSFYNPKARKTRGVWYTPKEVVDFIVRSLDKILQIEYNLEGIADKSKIKIKVDSDGWTKSGKRKQKEISTHKVQILDPATGTGTFLANIVEHIKEKFEFKEFWKDYVNKDLIPRLNGFELLMAPYAMAHLKLDMILDTEIEKRLNIYLTNSLEPPHEEAQTLFSSYMAQESNQADKIKKETPIMCVIGNPPYSGISSNKIEFIDKLMEDYKKEYTGEKLKERNPKWLNDDYVKFIRFAEYMVNKNKEGIIAFINPHGFLDNPTFRGMRYHLLKSFDKIYILNLHGNSRKKETTPTGEKDENVFDIMQGVSINIFIKTSNSKNLAKVYYADLWGKRKEKQEFLNNNDINSIKWEKINYKEPQFYFIPKDTELEEEYNQGFGVNELFGLSSVGIVTGKDKEYISFEKFDTEYNQIIQYRPFDYRYINFDLDKIERSRIKTMKHFINKDNLGLIVNKPAQGGPMFFSDIFITKYICDQSIFSAMNRSPYICPLYTYNDLKNEKTINFNSQIISKIEKSLNLKFQKDFNELDVFDYIYAVLHSPTYREKYKEFLKTDFPKIPYPKDKDKFFKLVEFGEKIRKLHLLEDNSLDKKVIELKGSDFEIKNKLVKKDIKIIDDKVQININETSSIIIPKVAFEFYIGGYQPAQKYLKDRVGQKLDLDIIKHYNKIINALLQTNDIMLQIKEIKL